MAGRVVQWVLRILAAGAVLFVLLLMAVASLAPEPDRVTTREGVLPVPPAADEARLASWTPSFSVRVVVRDDGSLRIREDIVADFAAYSRHGIERIIPEVEDVEGGGERLFEVTDLRVSTSRGTPGDVAWSTDATDLTVRIGDPDRTVRGVHAYRLEYTIPAGVTRTSAALRLVWDAISAWRMEIGTLAYEIRSPALVVGARCQAGPPGSHGPCDTLDVDGGTVTMAVAGLVPSEAVTARLRWDRDAFGPVAPPAAPASVSDRVGGWGGVVTALGALAVLGLAQLVIVRRARRDDAVTPANLDATFAVRPSTTGGGAAGTSPTLPLVTPADLHAVGDEPVVEFVPPQRFRPAELAALLHRGSGSTRLAGTAIDLAARGYYDLAATDPTDPSPDDWTLTWKGGRDPAPLCDYEQDVLATLFAGSATVRLADRKTAMPGLATRHGAAVKRHLRALGLVPRRTRALTGAHLLCGALTALALVAAAAVLATIATEGIIAWILVPVGLVLGLVTIFVPVSALTPLGAAMAWRARGFRRLFEESESYHAELAANAGLLRDYTGYAVTLGRLDRWTAAFPAEVVAAQGPMLSPLAIAAFHHSVVTTSTPPRSTGSSGSSGGSFGGGGSGGGGGGGGGGAW